ncbi:hypothetical protein [Photorhabdus khanii]|uniref:hypothetical protein n=1 Tax=Photorhabdus khanii TaxID=1004150 RepID=UPI001040B9C1|nr:hypothetical protein [Photorhabdus khanii]
MTTTRWTANSGLSPNTYVAPGNVRDTQFCIERLGHQMVCFAFSMVTVGLDASYFTVTSCHLVETRHIISVLGGSPPK